LHGTRVFTVALLVLALAGAAAADDFRVEASVDRGRVGVGETLTLTITVYGRDKVEEPSLDSLEGFQVVNTYTSHSFSMVNMQVSRSLSLQYVLVAVSEGEYTLGPFSVRSGNEVIETEPIRVAVTKSGAGPPVSPSQTPQAGQPGSDMVLLRASVDRTRAFVGQQILYTVEFAYRVRMQDQTQYLPPDHSGFWFEDLGDTGPAIQTIDGTRYYVITKRTAFFPISSGRYTIGEAAVRYVMEAVDPFSRDPFGLFSRDPFAGFRGREGVAKSKPIDIDVLPLPAQGRPSDFSGAVGRFDISAVPSREEVGVGESLTLSVRVKGRGNIKSIGDIAVPEFPNFRVFAPKARESVDVEQLQVGGVKTFDLVLVPQMQGEYALDGFTFSYFDPVKGCYERVSPEPISIRVTPGSPDVAVSGQGAMQAAAVTRRDIRHIRRGAIGVSGMSVSPGGLGGIVLRYLPVIAIVAGIVVGASRRHAEASGRTRIRKALGSVSRNLKIAESLIKNESRLVDASGLAARALRGYIAARAGTSEAAVDEAFVSSLEAMSPDRRSEVNDLIAQLDRIRFSPVGGSANQVLALIEQARGLVRSMDREWER
jgi:hypothetical protein